MVHSRAIAVVRAELRIAVIRHTDDEEVLPLRGRLEASNEASQRLIEVGKGIRHGRGKTLIRHVKRLVTAEREHRLVPRAVRRHTDDLIIEDVESRAVRHPPVRPREATRERVVIGDLLIARSEEVALHTGEVRIASVEEARRIARLTQAPCDGGQGTTLRRELHHRVCGEARVAAEDRDEPAVGAVAIGVAAREEDTLTSQAIKVRTDLGLLSQDTRIASAVALEDEEDDIRSAGRQQRITLKGLGGEEVFGQLTERLLIEGIILGIVVLSLPQRGEEAEERIDGCMIEVLAVTEVDLSDIGCRLTHAPTDHEEGRTQEEDEGKGVESTSAKLGPAPLRRAVEGEANRQADDEHKKDREKDEGKADTREGFAWLIQIEEDRGIELEAPEGIEPHIGDAHDADEGSREDVISSEGATGGEGAEEAAHGRRQEGYDEQVAQHGEVQAQPVIEYSEDVPHTQRPFGWDEQQEAALEDEEAQQHHEGEAEEVKDS